MSSDTWYSGSSAGASWFGAKDPKKEEEFFSSIAVDPPDLLQVYDEIKLPAAQREAWFQDRQGAIIGDALAKQKGWKVGDKIVLAGTIYPGDWEFHVSGIYTADRATVDRATLWFHYKYLNESQPPRLQDQVGWIMARVQDPSNQAAASHRFPFGSVQVPVSPAVLLADTTAYAPPVIAQ